MFSAATKEYSVECGRIVGKGLRSFHFTWVGIALDSLTAGLKIAIFFLRPTSISNLKRRIWLESYLISWTYRTQEKRQSKEDVFNRIKRSLLAVDAVDGPNAVRRAIPSEQHEQKQNRLKHFQFIIFNENWMITYLNHFQYTCTVSTERVNVPYSITIVGFL